MKASIIISSFNYGHFLPRCIESALAQLHPDTEVIVADDCSTDDSHDIVREYGGRIIPVIKPSNGGHASTFNAGFAASTGQFIMFLDADDYLYPDAVSEMLGAWRPGAAMVQGWLDLVDAAGLRTGLHPASARLLDKGFLLAKLLSHGRVDTTVTSGLGFSRDALKQVMPIPEQAFAQGADGYLASVCPLLGEVQVCDAVIGAYRQHQANHSQFARRLPARARWQIQHDQHRYAAIRAAAGTFGLRPAADLGGADIRHLQARVASLRLERELHPVREDGLGQLIRKAMTATRAASQSSSRRWATRLWFLGAAWLPSRPARTLIEWTLMPSLRPPSVKRWGRRIKHLIRRNPAPPRMARHPEQQASDAQP